MAGVAPVDYEIACCAVPVGHEIVGAALAGIKRFLQGKDGA